MRIIEKEIICRVGKDWHSKHLFIGELMGLDSEIANAVTKELDVSPGDLHDRTCVIKKMNATSITGDGYLAEKVLKMKVLIVVGNCKLVDDVEQTTEVIQENRIATQ